MSGFIFSDRDRIRTCDRLLRRQMLYPAELLDHFKFGRKLKTFSVLKTRTEEKDY
jgi:hypothetical protein